MREAADSDTASNCAFCFISLDIIQLEDKAHQPLESVPACQMSDRATATVLST